MMCAACSARVERAINGLEGVEECSVNLLSGTLSVETDLPDRTIIEAVEVAGYKAKPKGAPSTDSDEPGDISKEESRVRYRLIFSVCIILPLMYLSMGYVMLSLPLPAFLTKSAVTLAVLQMLLSGAVLIVNRKFFISGVKAVLSGAPNMDTLVSLGSGISYVYSVVVVFGIIAEKDPAVSNHLLHSLYFESAAMILTLITV